jgi:hypothetical protein
MGAFSIWHWLVLLLTVAAIYASGRILWRLGISPLWLLLAWIPGINVALLFWLAHAKWPNVRS